MKVTLLLTVSEVFVAIETPVAYVISACNIQAKLSRYFRSRHIRDKNSEVLIHHRCVCILAKNAYSLNRHRM